MNTLFDDVIDRMVESGELLPDGAEHIRTRGWGGRLPPGDALVRLFDHLEGPGPDARAANPLLRSGDVATPGLRARGPNYAVDDGRSPLRKMLDRFPLAEGAAEALEAEWAFSIGRGTPGRMAREIARRLEDRANHRHLADPPARPASEERLSGVLLGRFSDIPVAARESMVKAWSHEFAGYRDEHVLTERIAQRLAIPSAAARYDVEPLAKDDPRLRAVAVAKLEENRAQRRDESGRFSRDPIYGGNPL